MEQHKDETIITNRELLRDIHTKVSEVHSAMYGDPKAGIPGVAHRVTKLEESDKKRSRMYILISALSTGIALGIETIKNHIK